MGGHCMGRWEWVGTAWVGGNGWALHGHSCREVGMAGQRAFFRGGGNGGKGDSRREVKKMGGH